MHPARMLITLGLVLLVAGALWMLADKLGMGSLPGDITVKRKNFTLYVPIVSSLVVSVVLTLLFNLLRK